MTGYVDRENLSVSSTLADFVENRALDSLPVTTKMFWTGLAGLLEKFTQRNRALLQKRISLQKQIDAWHINRRNTPLDPAEYRTFLTDAGYIVPQPEPFTISTSNVDAELATLAGPQLVVPALNARYALNAANARWASLYDALYGTDALGQLPHKTGHEPQRRAKTVAWVKNFLNQIVPLDSGSHHDVNGYTVDSDGCMIPYLAEQSAFVGYRGPASSPTNILLRHQGKHIDLHIDRDHPVGSADKAGIADVTIEAALSTIVDLEDSIAAVDAQDKTNAYANWLGLMRGDLKAGVVNRSGHSFTRTLAADRNYTATDGTTLTLKGRSLLMVRNVGHLMTTDAVLLPDESCAPEGIVDAAITSMIALHDRCGPNAGTNSRTGAIYIVKPKMHGPEECAFANDLFDAVEDMLCLPRHTIKIGLMDEERRSSVNLAACIAAVAQRIVFVNTGFLDRTGDEIHTSMHAGAMTTKTQLKQSAWLAAYEQRNIAVALECGFDGRAQIGKGMWPAPDHMADMMAQKIAHPQSGANTAWVPSPTAAALHATHYHRVNIANARARTKSPDPLDILLSIPLMTKPPSPEVVARELDSCTQSILGYVARWIDQGVGCSKVPDIDDTALMEDRATLRISSQLLANWLAHDICTPEQIDDSLRRMAIGVDAQNAADPDYTPMAPQFDGLAFGAARSLIFKGARQPNGYTEPILHQFRLRAKKQTRSA